MILNNLKNYLKLMNFVGGNGVITPHLPVTFTDGVLATQFCTTVSTGSSGSMNFIPFFASVSNTGLTLLTTQTSRPSGIANLLLGKGTTPTSSDDYRIEDIISENISLHGSSKQVSTTMVDGKLIRKATLIFSVKNTGSTDLTVSELGLLHGYYTTSTSTTYAKPFLIHREVLETPVTIPAGGIRVFQFEFEFVNQLA